MPRAGLRGMGDRAGHSYTAGRTAVAGLACSVGHMSVDFGASLRAFLRSPRPVLSPARWGKAGRGAATPRAPPRSLALPFGASLRAQLLSPGPVLSPARW
eukprot:1419107-Alexandrium_andersonii.AAC.1